MTENRVVWGAVIVAAGSGSRFGGEIPKQFTYLLGKQVIDFSVDMFRGEVPLTVVVLPQDSSTVKWIPPEDVFTVSGGKRRQDSVLNGVEKVIELGATHVLVHDGARPSVDRDTLRRTMESAEATGTGLPCIPVRDTVKRTVDGVVIETVDRTDLQLAQTPQAFKAEILLQALRQADSVTDESSAVEALGFKVSAVEGSRRNIKLTDREDRFILERIMSSGKVSIGTGLDFHPFSPERPLIFSGCRLDEKNGLEGHSDGDVVLHAVADAILAAARAGDIGTLFPPDDSKWKNADSAVLLAQCAEVVRLKGWKVTGVDVTVIGERPKVSRRREMFINRIAEILEVSSDTIWIKGTTTNTIGELARGAGVGCHVVAELERMQ